MSQIIFLSGIVIIFFLMIIGRKQQICKMEKDALLQLIQSNNLPNTSASFIFLNYKKNGFDFIEKTISLHQDKLSDTVVFLLCPEWLYKSKCEKWNKIVVKPINIDTKFDFFNKVVLLKDDSILKINDANSFVLNKM